MPWILWRHLLSELLKVLLLTASVIVVVVAFGAAIKPLADNALGPGSVLKYVALATVPMMQFALPFAAGFAATIVLHRFASDTYFSTLPGPRELSASGLMAAPNATTTTITDAVSSSTLSSSVRRCRQRIQGMRGGVWSGKRPTASGQRRPYSFSLR